MTAQVNTEVTFDTVTSESLDGLPTMAAKIRYLATLTTQRGQIAKKLGIRYQWVRNVLETPIKGQ